MVAETGVAWILWTLAARHLRGRGLSVLGWGMSDGVHLVWLDRST